MRMRSIVMLALVASFGLAAPARAEVKLTINEGRVSLTATNATVREILAEWAKVGKTQIVNAERIVGGPISVQLDNVYEQQALDVILRSVSAYLAAPRPQLVANTSRFDRILLLPTSNAPRNVTPPAPAFPQPQFNPPPPPQALDDDDDAVPGRGQVPLQRGPIFNTFPQPQAPPLQPGQPNPNPVRGATGPASNPFPTGVQRPAGVAVPGMIVQPPQQPGQQPQFFQQDR